MPHRATNQNPEGRWNPEMRRQIRQAEGELVWTKGTLGWSASLDGKAVAVVRKTGASRQWMVRVHGFEFRHAPNRVIPRWHYSPPAARDTISEAKATVEAIIREARSGRGKA